MKIFLMSFTLFLSAYLWATTFTLTNPETGTVTTVAKDCDDDDNSHTGEDYSACVQDLSDFCDMFTNFSEDQCFQKSVNACDNDLKSDCVKDMAIYCDYNTSYSNNQCWEKAVNACSGNSAAMRDISESTKRKSVGEVRKLELN